jgi:tetratricopeptide (TPR) repeat protein
MARQAIRFAPDDPEALATGGFALGYFGEDIEGAIRLIDRSLALNPSFARGWVLSAVLRNFAGQPSLAIEHYNTSLRLSPRDRLGVLASPWTPLISSTSSLTMQQQFYTRRWSKRRVLWCPTGFSHLAMRIWGGSTKRGRS